MSIPLNYNNNDSEFQRRKSGRMSKMNNISIPLNYDNNHDNNNNFQRRKLGRISSIDLLNKSLRLSETFPRRRMFH